MGEKFDFSGYATKNDLRCTDGRTIRKDAFKNDDGRRVPLVWQHQHNSPDNVLGHAILENRDDGVYMYGKFNNTKKAQDAKEAVEHGDITALSIFANQLQQRGGDVMHGVIREVSLVLAGANEGAVIEFPVLAHSGEEAEDEAIIYMTSEDAALSHADKEDEKDDEPKEERKDGEDDETVMDVFNTLTEKQKNVVYYMLDQALADTDDEDDEDDEVKHSEIGGNEEVKKNVFENDPQATEENTLSHADMATIFADARRSGSLKDATESFLAHADGDTPATITYGIENIDYLFPDARTLNNVPDFIQRDMGWVQKVMNGTHHSPFSRIKSIHANITEDEARAKGYIKGKLKKEEVFSLLKRATTPQTIYKKQKLDRDDIIDITDFDVVAWIKAEMRMMLNEEIARAILVGDGRLSSDDDKISEDHVRPIWKEASLYAVQTTVNVASGADEEAKAKAVIKAAIRARKNYKGSGNPTFFTTEDMLTEMLLIEDGIGHPLYPDEAALARKLRVREIVTVPVMENLTNGDGDALAGIIVNLNDYNVGADKGGSVNMFEDFDIDYNQEKYLIETRISGALVKPYSALVLNLHTATSTVSESGATSTVSESGAA